MSYTIQFVGLIALHRRTVDGKPVYEALFPDGRTSPNICQKRPPAHHPYLIVRKNDIHSSGGPWNVRFLRDDCVAFELVDPITIGNLRDAGDLDESLLQTRGLHWLDIDNTLVIDQATAPTVTRFRIARGVFAPYLFPDGRNVITQLVVQSSVETFKVEGSNDRMLTLRNGAELGFFNVTQAWLDDGTDDGVDDFFIYYLLGTGGACRQPQDKTLDESPSNHPFIRRKKGLSVSCSNTTYP